MDEKRIPAGIVSVVLTLLVLAGCDGDQKPQPAAEPITRLGKFYVGMPWEEATKYLHKDVEIQKPGIVWERDPERGEPMYLVEGKYKDFVLTLDHTKSIIRIDRVDPRRRKDE